MANWYGTSLSNYVRVDPDKLKIMLELFNLRSWEYSEGLYAFASNTEFGDSPGLYEIDEDQEALIFELGIENADNIDELNFLDVVHTMLLPGEVFVWMEIGSEKIRYLTGMAIAIDHTGQVLKRINLDDIHEPGWTKAQY